MVVLVSTYFNSHNTKAKKLNDEIKTDSKHWGWGQAKFGCPQRGRFIPDRTNMNKGRERSKFPKILLTYFMDDP